MKLCNLKPPTGLRKGKKRVGRGDSSGHGKTAGRGTKGQLSRSGGKTRIGFEGGQMPLQRRIPHLKGFKNTRKKEFNIVNVGQLEIFDNQSIIGVKLLEEKGFIKKNKKPVKILGKGELTKSFTVRANYFSSSAVKKIEKAGGKTEVI